MEVRRQSRLTVLYFLLLLFSFLSFLSTCMSYFFRGTIAMLYLCCYIAYATVFSLSIYACMFPPYFAWSASPVHSIQHDKYLLQIIFNCTRERSGLFQLFRRVQSYNQFLTFKKEDIFPFKNNATCLCTFWNCQSFAIFIIQANSQIYTLYLY